MEKDELQDVLDLYGLSKEDFMCFTCPNGAFCGLKIIENDLLLERYQFRFPRTKKKRICKKWRAREHNFKMRPSKNVLKTSLGIICHPDVAKEIRKIFSVH